MVCTCFFIGLFFSLLDSLGGPFPSTAHRCHHKPKRCLPLHPCGGVPVSPLLFHPNAKGSQIVMDLAQRSVKRQASFCNAITFSNRPIALYEQVRLKVGTRKGVDESRACWIFGDSGVIWRGGVGKTQVDDTHRRMWIPLRVCYSKDEVCVTNIYLSCHCKNLSTVQFRL